MVASLIASGCAYLQTASVDSSEVLGSGGVSQFSVEESTVSANGRFVAFESDATNLVGSDTNGKRDVFVRDLASGTTERVSLGPTGGQLTGNSSQPSLSADGARVLFAYDGTDIDGAAGVFLRDRTAGTTTRVDYRHDGTPPALVTGSSASISGDGQFVAFSSADDLFLPPVGGSPVDGNGVADVWVRDLGTGTVSRVSEGSGGVEADGASTRPTIDADGSHVAFVSTATNLVAGDTNSCAGSSPSCADVFVADSSGVERLSVAPGPVEANAASRAPMISADGSTVVFKTFATNLVAGVTAPPVDGTVVVADTATGQLESLGPIPSAPTVSGASPPSVSSDGRYVAFESDLALTPEQVDDPDLVYVLDRATNTPYHVSTDKQLAQGPGSYTRPRLSADGRYVAMSVNCCTPSGQVEVRAVTVPEVETVTPPTMPVGEATELTVGGSGFLPGAVAFGLGEGTQIVATERISESEMRVTIQVEPSATTGARTVRIANTGTGPGMIAGATGECVGCVSIVDDRPNVVVVMVDDARPDEMTRVADLKPDGGFDWIRDNGVQFDQLFMTNNLCCPARVTLMTGQTSYNHGKEDNKGFLDLQNSLALWMQDAGYCTALSGKWLNNTDENRHLRPAGWTYWEPLISGFADEYGYTVQDNEGNLVTPGIYQSDYVAQQSLGHLESCLDTTMPAFVNFWPFPPHFGSQPEPDYENTPVTWSNPDPSFNEADISDKPTWVQVGEPETNPNEPFVAFAWNEARVRTMLTVDDGIKALIDELAARGELSNTVIMLLGDNGSLMGEHRIMNRKNLAYEAAQPTLWMAGPGFPTGATSSAYIGNVDLAPTIVEIGRADAGLVIDGRPIQDVLASPDLGNDRFMPIHVASSAALPTHPSAQGIRTSRYKYVEYSEAAPIDSELYDLVTDPYELDNLVDVPAYDGIEAAMQSLLASSLTCSGSACRASVDPSLRAP